MERHLNLRKEARGRECQVRISGICNYNPETTVLAHIRLAGLTGVGIKSDDLLAAWCCSDCHFYCESRYNDRDTRAFYEGVLRTQAALIKEGKITW